MSSIYTGLRNWWSGSTPGQYGPVPKPANVVRQSDKPPATAIAAPVSSLSGDSKDVKAVGLMTAYDPELSAYDPRQPQVLSGARATTSEAVFPIPNETNVVGDFRQQYENVIGYDQLLTGVPGRLQQQVAQLNRIWSSASDKKVFDVVDSKNADVNTYRTNMLALTGVLNNRVEQFRAAVAIEAKARLDAQVRNDPKGLIRMLNGVREFATLVAKLAPSQVIVNGPYEDATTRELKNGPHTEPKDKYVERWNRLVEDLTSIVGEANDCPETLFPDQMSLIGQVAYTVSQDEKRTTISGSEGLETVKDRIKMLFLNSYQKPEYNPLRFVTVYGVGQTGKTLIVREALSDLAFAMRDFVVSKRGPAASIAAEAKKWDFSQFLQVQVADAVTLRFDTDSGEETSPQYMVDQIRRWLDCAEANAKANSAFFAARDVPIQRKTVLIIKNLDTLFVSDKTIRESSARPTQSFALETASRVYVANRFAEDQTPVTANGTPIEYGLLGSIPTEGQPSAPAATTVSPPPRVDLSIPLPPDPIRTPPGVAPTSVAAVGPTAASTPSANPPASVGATPAGGAAFAREGGARIGSDQQRAELERALLHLFRSDYMLSKYPNVWIVFTMRFAFHIPKPLRTLVAKDSVRVDLPSDALRRAIFKTEWDRMYTNSMVERVLRMVHMVEDAGGVPVRRNGKLDIDYKVQPTFSPFFTDITKVYLSTPKGQWGPWFKNNENDYYLLEHWIAGHLFFFYMRALADYPDLGKTATLQTMNDEFKRRLIRNQIATIRLYTYDPLQAKNDDFLVRDVYLRVRNYLYNIVLERSGLLNKLVSYTGMSEAGICALQRAGIPDTYINKYLQRIGRETTGGKWIFGLNLEEMYQFTQALEQETQRVNLQRAVDESKRYLNKQIFAPGCSSTARLIQPIVSGDDSSGWKLDAVQSDVKSQSVQQAPVPVPYTSSRLPQAQVAAVTAATSTPGAAAQTVVMARPTSSGPVVQYEQSSCQGSVDILDLPIITTNIDYVWNESIVNTVIAKIKDAKMFPTNKGYVEFVREYLFENPQARGIGPPGVISARCRQVQAQQDREDAQLASSRESRESERGRGLRPGIQFGRTPGVVGSVRPLSLNGLQGRTKAFGGLKSSNTENDSSLNVLVETRVSGGSGHSRHSTRSKADTNPVIHGKNRPGKSARGGYAASMEIIEY